MCSTPSEKAASPACVFPCSSRRPINTVIRSDVGSLVSLFNPTSIVQRARVLSTLARNLVMLHKKPPSNPEFWIPLKYSTAIFSSTSTLIRS